MGAMAAKGCAAGGMGAMGGNLGAAVVVEGVLAGERGAWAGRAADIAVLGSRSRRSPRWPFRDDLAEAEVVVATAADRLVAKVAVVVDPMAAG